MKRIAGLIGLVLLTTALGGAAPDAALRPLPFYYDLYTFRGAGGTTDVVAAFAVPAGRLRAEDRRAGVRYRFDVTLVLADTARRTVSRTDDSVFVATRRALDADHLLYTQVDVRAAPSRSTLQRVIMTDASAPGIGQLYGGPFPVPDYRGRRLMMSDVVLGQPTGAAGWRRGGHVLALLPTDHLPAAAFDVYYEVYNLPARRAYSTEIAIERLDAPAEADDRWMRLRFEGEAASTRNGTLVELRRIDTAVREGRYRLTIAVRDEETGHVTRQSRLFRVRGPQGGATMVPARPLRERTARR